MYTTHGEIMRCSTAGGDITNKQNMNENETNKSKINKLQILLRILIALILLAGFVTLSILTFYYIDEPASSDSMSDLMSNVICIYGFAAFLFLFGFIAFIIPNHFYNVFYKFGFFLMQHSVYYDDLVGSKKGCYKTYKITFLRILIFSYILLIIAFIMSIA